MAKFFCFGLVLMFFSCQKQEENTQKTATNSPNIFVEIAKKGKYKNPRKIDVTKEIPLHKADSLFKKMSELEFDTLQLNKKYSFKTMSSGNYFYGFEERQKFNMLFIYIYKDHYCDVVDMITYDKKLKMMSNLELSQYGGDGGVMWYRRSEFLNDSILNVTYQYDFFSLPERNFENICEKYITKYQIRSNGKIDSLSTQFLIKPDTNCYKRGKDFFDKINPPNKP